MTDRENWLRAIAFDNPKWIPCDVGMSPLTWHAHRGDLEELVMRHPLIFPSYEKGSRDFDWFPPTYRFEEAIRDNWGCVWQNAIHGIEGQVIEHPLSDWDALTDYRLPDPEHQAMFGERDWCRIQKEVAALRKRGQLALGDGERLFDRLYMLRGFENLMVDIATDDPHLPNLIELLWEYERKLVKLWLEIGVDVMYFHTDIGTQDALMISPEKFRQYIKPMFKDLFTMCRNGGAHVYLSSDGVILEVVDDLLECGVSMHDPQVGANTLEDIERVYKGKMCINLDLDRQIFPFCSPDDIRRQVKDSVDRLYLPEGGLMVGAGVFDETTPLKNIEAICEAMEEYCLNRPAH